MLKRCGVCNKEFEPCNQCPSGGYAWRKTVCCVEHSVPFLAILEYKRNLKSKDEAMEILNKYTDIEYNDDVKKIVDEILFVPVAESIESEIDEADEPVSKPRSRKKS